MINAILLQLAAEPSKNAKIDILKQHLNNETLKQVLKLALDPTINFYIKKIPAFVPSTGAQYTLADMLPQLEQLSSRKVTGNDAIDFLANMLCMVNKDDAEVITKIIARDLRCGVQDSTVNKVWKELIPEFPYMRCSLLKSVKPETFSWKNGVFSQMKADGIFCSFNHDADGNVTILSRSGSQFPLDEFAKVIADAKLMFPLNTQTHGELLIKRDGIVLEREIGNGILNSVLKNGKFADNEEPVYMIWDQIPLTSVVSKGVYNVPYKERFATLAIPATVNNIILIPTKIVHSLEEAWAHYEEMVAQGYEGTIFKDENTIWKDGTSKTQIKLKLEVDLDLVIVGFNAGKGKNAELFGSIIAQSSDGKLEVGISGFKDAVRKEIHEMRDELIGTIITVKSNNLMKPSASNEKYSVFLPRFVELRSDKHVADSLERVIEQFDNAVKF